MTRCLDEDHSQDNNESFLSSSNHSAEPECPVAEIKTLKRKLNNAEDKLVASRKKIKVLLQQSKRRLTTKNGDLKNVVSELKRKCFISEDSLGVLEKCAEAAGCKTC